MDTCMTFFLRQPIPTDRICVNMEPGGTVADGGVRERHFMPNPKCVTHPGCPEPVSQSDYPGPIAIRDPHCEKYHRSAPQPNRQRLNVWCKMNNF